MPWAIRSAVEVNCATLGRAGVCVPLPAGGTRLGPDALELGRFGGALEHLLAGNALAQDLSGWCLVAYLVHPPPAEFERRDAQGFGYAVDLHLDRELGLWRAEAAERAVRWRVRRNDSAVYPHIGARVRAAGM